MHKWLSDFFLYCVSLLDMLTFQSLPLLFVSFSLFRPPPHPDRNPPPLPLLLSTILHLVPSVFSCFSRVFLLIPDFPWSSWVCISVCLCVHVEPGVCSLGCVCQWCWGRRRVWVGAARALWPGASERNSLHSQGSAWDKSATALHAPGSERERYIYGHGLIAVTYTEANT